MVSTPGGPPYSPPSPETLHAVIAETLLDFPNKSPQQKLNCLQEIDELLLPLIEEVKEGVIGNTSSIQALNAKAGELGHDDITAEGDGRKSGQERKESVVSQMSEKLKGVLQLNGKKAGGQEREKKDKEKEKQTESDNIPGAQAHTREDVLGLEEDNKLKEYMLLRSSLKPADQEAHAGSGSSAAAAAAGTAGALPTLDRIIMPQAFTNILKPTSEEEVIKIVKKAYADNAIVRVIGSGHSVSSSIYDEENNKPPGQKQRPIVLLSLTKMRKITIDSSSESDVRVTAEGGCNIGVDPANPDSTLNNSLVYTLNNAGYALSDLAGITQQTVSGFIATSSSGGTVKASFLDSLYGLRLVDGTGKLKVLTRGDADPSDFYAAGVSMGLFGVITSVTLGVQATYFITGTQTVSPLSQLSTDPSKGSPIDLLGPGTKDIPSMQQNLENTEYTRCLWWPQVGLNRLVIWKASSIPPVNPQTGQSWTIEPYEELPQVGGSSALAQIAARTVLIALNLLESDNPVYQRIAATLIGFFNPITEPGKPQTFRDQWFNGLPMDNEISDVILPVSFSELWFPISETQVVLNDLHELFTTEFNAIGNFTTEIYPAKKSPFWLSPSYDGDVVRVNVYYFSADPRGTPEEFFGRYWRWFDQRGRVYRCHWGKYIPPDFGKVVNERFRMHSDWLRVREKMDPKQIFVTPYWRSHLAIPPPSATRTSKIMMKLQDALFRSSAKQKPQGHTVEREVATDKPKKTSVLKRVLIRMGCFKS